MSDEPQQEMTSAPLPPPRPPVAPSGLPLPPRPPSGDAAGAWGPGGTSFQGIAAKPPLRPGQLPVAWQIFVAVAWTAGFFAYAAVWKTSAEIGIGTWWLGPRSLPQPTLIRILPFLLTITVSMCAIYNVRRTALISVAGSAVAAVIAVFDISRSGGLAAIEFAIAAFLLLASIGALAGTVRRPAAH